MGPETGTPNVRFRVLVLLLSGINVKLDELYDIVYLFCVVLALSTVSTGKSHRSMQ